MKNSDTILDADLFEEPKNLKYSTIQLMVFVLFIGILQVLIWNFSSIPLSDITLRFTGEISALETTPYEATIYIILSLLTSLALCVPFYVSNKVTRMHFLVTVSLFVVLFSYAAIRIDYNLKGIFLTQFIGDDFGFSWPVIRSFLFLPIIIYLMIIFLMRFISPAYILLKYLIFFLIILHIGVFLHDKSTILDWQATLSQGYFLFLLTVGFGIIGITANRV